MARAARILLRLRQAWSGPNSARWLGIAVACGAVAGFLVTGYGWALAWATELLQGQALGLALPGPDHGASLARPWLLPVATTAVGALTGLLIARFVPESSQTGTDGTDAMIRAFHQAEGRIRPAAAIIRTLTSILTLAGGGSAGKEGPVAYMGAGFGSWLSTRLGFSARDRRILLLAGAAGGLGAIFRAPLGGALTVVEVLYAEDFEAEALLPAVLSSVTSYGVCTLFTGSAPVVDAPVMALGTLLEAPFYLALAVACAGSAWLYVRGFFLIKYRVFVPLRARLGIPLTTALGGLVMGLLGMAFPSLLGSSHASLELAILGQLPAVTLAGLLLGKILATSVTIGSGFSGGMFAPGLFVGAMTGGLVGSLGHAWRPDIVAHPGAYALVGMSAFFAAAANAALGPMVMVCEITRGYGLLAPLMLCSAVALMLSGRRGLYENQLPGRGASPAHRGEAAEAALEQVLVAQVFKRDAAVVLEEGTTLGALADVIAATEVHTFPVRGAGGAITGLVALKDVRRVMFENALFALVVVRDLARPPALLTLDQDLRQALGVFADTRLSQLPVADAADPSNILGMLSVDEVLAAEVMTQASSRPEPERGSRR